MATNTVTPTPSRQSRVEDALARAKREQYAALEARLSGNATRAEQHDALADLWVLIAVKEARRVA